MIDNGMVYFAKAGNTSTDLGEKIYLNPKMANRHGFICGATGTGKTITLKVLAESFSSLGVPVFVSDVKGDVSGLMKPGEDSENMQQRIARFGLENFAYKGYPCTFYDIYAQKGIPLRTTVSEMGPLLMARVLNLNDTQADLLSVIYKMADDQGLLLIDTKDLKAMLSYATDNADELSMDYGHIAKASTSTIIRAIVALEAEGGDQFFGEPAFDIKDFFTTDCNGMGMINILHSETLINTPRLYSAFMLFLLSELFEVLPEVGDPEKPRMVFFFDEAHLIFNNATQALLEKIEQVVKLIRSKGVGIYFATQSPGDIPGGVMAQLSNKIEHALHAYTPAEQKALRAAGEAFRVNPDFDTIELLQQLGTGEAIVSTLDEKGVPTIAQHAFILPPESYMGSISDEERASSIGLSNLNLKYSEMIDRDSAYEFLQRQMVHDAEAAEARKAQLEGEKAEQEAAEKAEKEAEKAAAQAEKEAAKAAEKAEKEAEKEAQKKKNAFLSGAKSVASTAGGTVGREIGKAVGGKLGKFGKTVGGNVGASLGRNILGTLFKL